MMKAGLKQLIWRVSPALLQRLLTPYSGQCFSIAIYSGKDIEDLQPLEGVPCPVITREDVTDVPASFVADPFMICHAGQWYLFFEVMPSISQNGQIGVATSTDLCQWRYEQIVLREPFHLAYPYVFEHEGIIYMIPDSPGNGVRLYKACDFPTQWTVVKEIRTDNIYSDSSVVYHGGLWWMFSAWAPDKASAKSLRLFYAEQLDGEWYEHRASPVESENQKFVRPCGRIIRGSAGQLLRFAQDGTDSYGECVRVVEVQELNKHSCREKQVDAPILSPGGNAWQRDGMHHIDAHVTDSGLVCCVDGWRWV